MSFNEVVGDLTIPNYSFMKDAVEASSILLKSIEEDIIESRQIISNRCCKDKAYSELIAALTEDNETLMKLLDNVQEDAERARDDLAASEETAANTAADFDAERDELVENYEEQLSTCNAEIERVVAQCNEEMRSKHALEKELSELRSSHDGVVQQCNAYQQVVEQQQFSIQELTNEVEEQKAHIARLEDYCRYLATTTATAGNTEYSERAEQEQPQQPEQSQQWHDDGAGSPCGGPLYHNDLLQESQEPEGDDDETRSDVVASDEDKGRTIYEDRLYDFQDQSMLGRRELLPPPDDDSDDKVGGEHDVNDDVKVEVGVDADHRGGDGVEGRGESEAWERVNGTEGEQDEAEEREQFEAREGNDEEQDEEDLDLNFASDIPENSTLDPAQYTQYGEQFGAADDDDIDTDGAMYEFDYLHSTGAEGERRGKRSSHKTAAEYKERAFVNYDESDSKRKPHRRRDDFEDFSDALFIPPEVLAAANAGAKGSASPAGARSRGQSSTVSAPPSAVVETAGIAVGSGSSAGGPKERMAVVEEGQKQEQECGTGMVPSEREASPPLSSDADPWDPLPGFASDFHEGRTDLYNVGIVTAGHEADQCLDLYSLAAADFNLDLSLDVSLTPAHRSDQSETVHARQDLRSTIETGVESNMKLGERPEAVSTEFPIADSYATGCTRIYSDSKSGGVSDNGGDAGVSAGGALVGNDAGVSAEMVPKPGGGYLADSGTDQREACVQSPASRSVDTAEEIIFIPDEDDEAEEVYIALGGAENGESVEMESNRSDSVVSDESSSGSGSDSTNSSSDSNSKSSDSDSDSDSLSDSASGGSDSADDDDRHSHSNMPPTHSQGEPRAATGGTSETAENTPVKVREIVEKFESPHRTSPGRFPYSSRLSAVNLPGSSADIPATTAVGVGPYALLQSRGSRGNRMSGNTAGRTSSCPTLPMQRHDVQQWKSAGLDQKQRQDQQDDGVQAQGLCGKFHDPNFMEVGSKGCMTVQDGNDSKLPVKEFEQQLPPGRQGEILTASMVQDLPAVAYSFTVTEQPGEGNPRIPRRRRNSDAAAGKRQYTSHIPRIPHRRRSSADAAKKVSSGIQIPRSPQRRRSSDDDDDDDDDVVDVDDDYNDDFESDDDDDDNDGAAAAGLPLFVRQMSSRSSDASGERSACPSTNRTPLRGVPVIFSHGSADSKGDESRKRLATDSTPAPAPSSISASVPLQAHGADLLGSGNIARGEVTEQPFPLPICTGKDRSMSLLFPMVDDNEVHVADGAESREDPGVPKEPEQPDVQKEHKEPEKQDEYESTSYPGYSVQLDQADVEVGAVGSGKGHHGQWGLHEEGSNDGGKHVEERDKEVEEEEVEEEKEEEEVEEEQEEKEKKQEEEEVEDEGEELVGTSLRKEEYAGSAGSGSGSGSEYDELSSTEDFFSDTEKEDGEQNGGGGGGGEEEGNERERWQQGVCGPGREIGTGVSIASAASASLDSESAGESRSNKKYAQWHGEAKVTVDKQVIPRKVGASDDVGEALGGPDDEEMGEVELEKNICDGHSPLTDSASYPEDLPINQQEPPSYHQDPPPYQEYLPLNQQEPPSYHQDPPPYQEDSSSYAEVTPMPAAAAAAARLPSTVPTTAAVTGCSSSSSDLVDAIDPSDHQADEIAYLCNS